MTSLASPARPSEAESPIALEGDGVSVSFGGVTALSDVRLRVRRGGFHGLIGPNGAGKTTLFNVLSGFQRPASGTVRLDGVDVSSLGPAARARRGLGRTFQRIELFDGLTVEANVAMGREAALAGVSPLRQTLARRAERREVARATAEALELIGLSAMADVPAGALSTGMRRLVEVGRVLAGDFHLLLLDEPSSGLDPAESEQLAGVLREVFRERSLTMVLVEHHIAMVMSLCQYVHVLDFGRLIFEGTPDQAAASPEVRRAYLGEQV